MSAGLTSNFGQGYTRNMRLVLYALLLASSGCYYQGYAVRRVMPAEPPISREEVERLTSAGISEAVILEAVEKRGAFPLTPDDLVALKKAGSSDTVVQKMIASERKQPDRVVVEDGYPGSYGYYPYYDYPYYYPGVVFGVGWGWGYHYYPRGSWGVRVYR